ncbi:MAG: hypothetical protein ACTHKD_15030 [Devosia sp.]
MSEKSSLPHLSRAKQKKRSQDRFVNYLLLRIILANPHPVPDVTDEQRLSQARQALFGEQPPGGRPEINDDVALFHIIAEMRKPEIDKLMRVFTSHVPETARGAWQAEIDRKPDSIRGATRKQAATARSYPGQLPEAVAERLRRKAIALTLTTQDMADIEAYLQGESWQAQLLDELADKLGRLGIKVTGGPVK